MQLVMTTARFSFDGNIKRIRHHRVTWTNAKKWIVHEHQSASFERIQTLAKTGVLFNVLEITRIPLPERAHDNDRRYQSGDHTGFDENRLVLPTRQSEQRKQGKESTA